MSASESWPVDRIQEKSPIEYRLASITKPPSGSQDIFQFYGIFGIGKTTLLLAFKDLFDKSGIDNAFIDFAQYTKTPHSLYIIKELANQLHGPRNRKERILTAIDEYQTLEQKLTIIGELSESSSISMQQKLQKIEDDFVYYLKVILEERPVILLFDRVECLTDGNEYLAEGTKVRTWLEELYLSVQDDRRLTLILSGRNSIRWNRRTQNMRAENPIELSFFNIEYAKEHFKRISAGTSYEELHEALGTFVYDFTRGHPFSNICLESKMRQFEKSRASKSVASDRVDVWDWASIFREATESMLNDWLQTSPDQENLKALIRAIALLRQFDRSAASFMFEKMFPDLASNKEQQIVMGHLTYLKDVTLLSRGVGVADQWFQMQAPIRCFVIEDLRRNRSEDYKRALGYARDYYRERVRETALNRNATVVYRHAVVELLYHETKLHELLDQPGDSNRKLALCDQLDFALSRLYNPNTMDYYAEMCDELQSIIDQDDELKGMLEHELESILAKLRELKTGIPQHRAYDVFISYNSKDHDAAQEFFKGLKARNIVPWIDKWEIKKLTPWQPELESIIKVIPAAVILIGPSGIEGPWQSKEINKLLAQFRERQILLGYVLLPDCPNNFRSRKSLEAFQRVDLRQGDFEEQMDQLAKAITDRR